MMLVKRYSHNGEVFSKAEHEYSVVSINEGYRIRATTSWDEYEQGMLAISDWKSVYQASRLIVNRTGKKPTSSTFARFDSRAMPSFETDMYGWGPVQALALANHLSRTQRSFLDDNGFLRNELVPEIIKIRARERGLPEVRTQLSQLSSGLVTIHFWGVKKGSTSVPLVHNSETCFHLAEFRIEEIDHGLPLKLYFAIYGLHVQPTNPNEPRKPHPISTVSFQGSIGKSVKGIFSETVYDSGTNIHVRDYRFPETKISYLLKPGDPLPWDYAVQADGEGNVAQRAYFAKTASIKHGQRKHQLVVGSIVIGTCIVAAVVFFRTQKK